MSYTETSGNNCGDKQMSFDISSKSRGEKPFKRIYSESGAGILSYLEAMDVGIGCVIRVEENNFNDSNVQSAVSTVFVPGVTLEKMPDVDGYYRVVPK